MKKLIMTALIAAVATPAAAFAQSNQELRRDRQDIRDQQRDLRDARRNGSYRDARHEQRQLHDARQEYREDRADRNRRWGNDDWRGWRDHNRGLYARGNWRAPFRYTAFRPGLRIGPSYFGPRYVIADPWRYRLPPTVGYQRWVRHYDDLLLVDTRRGVVLRVLNNFYW